MNSPVLSELSTQAEGFPTVAAFVGLLTRVNSLMLGKARALLERFPTFLTLKGLLSSLSSLVLNKGVIVGKGFIILARFK